MLTDLYAQAEPMLILLAIYAALWFANTIVGIRNNLTQGFKWDTKKFLNGLITALLGAVGLAIGAIALHFLPVALDKAGLVLSQDLKQTISLLGVVGAIGSGIIVYGRKYVDNMKLMFNPDNKFLFDIKMDEKNFNKGQVIYKSVQEFDKDANEDQDNLPEGK